MQMCTRATMFVCVRTTDGKPGLGRNGLRLHYT